MGACLAVPGPYGGGQAGPPALGPTARPGGPRLRGQRGQRAAAESSRASEQWPAGSRAALPCRPPLPRRERPLARARPREAGKAPRHRVHSKGPVCAASE